MFLLTLADIYAVFSSGSLDGGLPLPPEYQTVVAKVQVGKTASDVFTSVQPEAKVVEVISILGAYIEFCVNKLDKIDCERTSDTPKRNAFQLMMNYDRELKCLPEPYEENDNKKKVKNIVREMLKSSDVGWSRDAVNVYGTPLINVIANCLWYLDGHHETLAGQSCSVPAELSHIQGYNKPESHGHTCKSSSPLTQSKVMEHSLAILHLTQQSYMKRE